VLSKYDRPCCERFKPADSFTPKNVVPDELDRSMVKAGVEKIKPRVVACGEQNGAKGTVRLAEISTVKPKKRTALLASPDVDVILGDLVRIHVGH